MDQERFDGLVRALGSGATRRGALGVLAGIAGLGLGEVAAKRRGRGRGKGKARLRAQTGNPDKKAICHHDEETGTFHLIEVDDSAVQKHLDNHGDFLPAAENGCCTDADCPNEGETCVVDDGTGSCQSSGPNPECAGATCATFIPCSSGNPDCICTTTAAGGGFCVPGSTRCDVVGPCDGDLGCPDGSICVVETCCGQPVCAPLNLVCSDDAATTNRSAASGGPTFAGR